MENDFVRNAFKMKLKPGFENEYKLRHDKIWPELKNLLSESGIKDYSIFLDKETLTLFAVQKISKDFNFSYLPSHPLVKKWWAYMADIMETNTGNSPIEMPLTEVFYLS
ncbi:L-rhamnose mutarotase [Polaribacter reichenbachii]|uniref:L-rhamnose mutarotase n=1 Tax=Polaribacter reichenbachii TaxID=996801 RepID=A0A1B8U6M0_9FLAO|nr:L-rhamnose mutarotase [Polaribacter reichenbachii]APZ46069.1 L-rhamnose mutarotase [Polaribacter reichenbachii]AUC19931.1 L-rhamnose mutarotase [Polaribacter reichenbachii]OBY67525.1 L-rhamnose mutarotase [Polaribacter reichenbachii]